MEEKDSKTMISVKHLSKKFGDVTVLKDISLDIKEKEVVVIIGPSGSGKSTILRCLNHLETPSGGEIVIDGIKLEEGANLNAIRREVGMVFQRFNLFPNMTVLQNIMLAPMQVRGKSKEEAKEKAMRLLKRVGLEHKADVMPDELSGGQQQRVAIARALVKLPRVLLLDEPLSNLDARLRLQTREEIRRIQQETQITTIFVTHDQDEAMSISDMIVVMKDGIVQQIGKPQNVYDDPVNLFVAKFLGTPPINVFSGEVKNEQLYIGSEAVLSTPGVSDQPVHVGIRPEGFILKEDGPLSCDLVRLEVMGRDVSIVSTHEKSQNVTIRSIIDADEGKSLPTGKVHFGLKPAKVFLFCTDTEERIRF